MSLLRRAAVSLSIGLATLSVVVPVESLTTETARTIDATMERWLAGPGATALSVAVGVGDEIAYARAFGLASVEHAVPADEGTRFRIASLTKTFTSAAIARLVENEQLSLEATLGAILPDVPSHLHGITVRQLLNHTSGVVSTTDLSEFRDRMATPIDRESMLDLFGAEALQFQPGVQWAYSNSGYYLLALAIERITGTAYGDVLREFFFEPLGLVDTTVDSSAAIISNRAWGYFRRDDGGIGRALSTAAENALGAGDMMSSATDLARWMIALRSGKVISKAYYRQMSAPTRLPDGAEKPYGLGLQLHELAGQQCVLHSGSIPGFNTIMLHAPSSDITIVVLSSSSSVSSATVAQELLETIVGESAPELSEIPVSILTTGMGRFSGEDSPPFEIAWRDGAVWLRAGPRPPMEMAYEGDGVFRPRLGMPLKLIRQRSGQDDAFWEIVLGSKTYTLRPVGNDEWADRINVPPAPRWTDRGVM